MWDGGGASRALPAATRRRFPEAPPISRPETARCSTWRWQEAYSWYEAYSAPFGAPGARRRQKVTFARLAYAAARCSKQ